MNFIDKDILLQRINTQFWSEIENIIISAPSIDIQQWIPCVEEMPEEFVYVLVCLKDGAMYVAQLTNYIDVWGNPKWCTNTKHCLGGVILRSEVIAWMPLPKPYGERREP